MKVKWERLYALFPTFVHLMEIGLKRISEDKGITYKLLGIDWDLTSESYLEIYIPSTRFYKAHNFYNL